MNTKRYHALIFDDGDICVSDRKRRYSVRVELNLLEYNLRGTSYVSAFEPDPVDACMFTMKLHFHVPPKKMVITKKAAKDGRILRWYEDSRCKNTRCNYARIEMGLKQVQEQVPSNILPSRGHEVTQNIVQPEYAISASCALNIYIYIYIYISHDSQS